MCGRGRLGIMQLTNTCHKQTLGFQRRTYRKVQSIACRSSELNECSTSGRDHTLPRRSLFSGMVSTAAAAVAASWVVPQAASSAVLDMQMVEVGAVNAVAGSLGGN
jgi:hypothetical protein